MTQRYIVASEHPGYDIVVTTEQRPSGSWAVVATVVHATPTGESTMPVPVPSSDFPTESDARDTGVRVAQQWIGENTPGENTAEDEAGASR
jgi:hypothetical protein